MTPSDREILQRWLDDELDTGERDAFERRIGEDPALRAELALHQEVIGSLQRGFAPPDIGVPLGSGSADPDAAVTDGPAASRRWPWFFAGAATAAIALLGWLQPWSRDDQHLRTAVGRSWLAACGSPEPAFSASECASPDQVPSYIQGLVPDLPTPLRWHDRDGVQFQRGLEPAPLAGLRVLELVVLPATEVFVFVVLASSDPRPILPAGSEWRLFRKVYGPLVAYEVTTLDEAHGLRCLATGN